MNIHNPKTLSNSPTLSFCWFFSSNYYYVFLYSAKKPTLANRIEATNTLRSLSAAEWHSLSLLPCCCCCRRLLFRRGNVEPGSLQVAVKKTNPRHARLRSLICSWRSVLLPSCIMVKVQKIDYFGDFWSIHWPRLFCFLTFCSFDTYILTVASFFLWKNYEFDQKSQSNSAMFHFLKYLTRDDQDQHDANGSLLVRRQYRTFRVSWLFKMCRYLHSSKCRQSPTSVNSISVGSSQRQASQAFPDWPDVSLSRVALWARSDHDRSSPMWLFCLISNHALYCSEFSFCHCANVSPLSVLLSHGPHSAQHALRGLQALCRGQGSRLLSKRRRVLHHWNGGRGSQTLQVSLMAFFSPLTPTLPWHTDAILPQTWRFSHISFLLFWGYMCLPCSSAPTVTFFLPHELKCISFFLLSPLNSRIRYAATASWSAEA